MFLLSLLRRTHSAVVVRTTLLATAALLCFWACAARSADDACIRAGRHAARDPKFKDKEAAVASLAAGHHPNALAVFKALLEGNLYYRRDDRRVFIAQTARRGVDADRPDTLRRRQGQAIPLTIRRSRRTTSCARRCEARIAGLTSPIPMRPCDWPLSRRCCARWTRRVRRSCARVSARRQDDEVRRRDSCSAGACRSRKRGVATRLAAVEQLAGNLSPDVYNRLTAMVRARRGRKLRGTGRNRPHRRDQGHQQHRILAQFLRRHRNAVLRAEPGFGARARSHRPRHHLRRDGRHQHGARRADDARRVHDVCDAAADAGNTSALRCSWRSRPPFSSQAASASSSSAESCAFCTAGRSKRCSRHSASAWSCSRSCATSSPPTIAPSKPRLDGRLDADQRGALDDVQPSLCRRCSC